MTKGHMSPFPLATKEGEGGGASAAERITAEFSRAVSKANRFMDADTSSNNGVVVVVVVVVVERFFFKNLVVESFNGFNGCFLEIDLGKLRLNLESRLPRVTRLV